MYFTSNKPKKVQNKKLEYCIRLDAKARLVLPLEIRDALGIKTKDKLLLSVSTTNDDKVIIELTKVPQDLSSSSELQPCSKNASYVCQPKKKAEEKPGVPTQPNSDSTTASDLNTKEDIRKQGTRVCNKSNLKRCKK
ncbi:AbrB/MazE/SpoVT family DNA-binding domain-containing protein [Candidatus Micrarchaeota archaeon]|nr:AbrB/MazE/SpoVT family DNA-binding domain-containing protein [Candidatus Micrarchaeota archaeon]MBU1165594.1 AbrB/MazE/SpoVT family DNA-binding domain-containing protein [Candidatus Micrarchaeota archaeon]MBU1887405.1 AbrB/MazE/SpoVT family DNA-binding domain-containing protein [Candidatus Micrarchaeota archaeon]